ncbi:glutamine amidotransferase [Pelagicoccus sp. SDUM812003]|uniref:glutamine amidotransferase n=1 Tax=Pelagicoccus sp. SDUM812003 TaxID=3041267 RepID=UPI0028109839|nr:glutamine amidotransferase [Pelagicoccus sp. SDUM812003]MDQ8204024.1 glutamine amidotransferase [Pelagicoccus sp. SDUM812003]
MIFPNNTPWILVAILAAALIFLSWRSWRGSSQRSAAAIALRSAGILLLALALLNPQRVFERPIQGQNIIALLADDSLGMRIKDPGELLDRGERMRQALHGRSSGWLTDLEEDYQVRSYRFSKSLQRISSYDSLAFEGQSSKISSALSSVQQRLDERPLAAIALLTDGNATDQPLSDSQLAELPPIFPVLIGEATSVPDLSIQRAELNVSAFGDAPLSLEAKFRLQGLGPSKVKTTLSQITPTTMRRDLPIEERTLTFEDEQQEMIQRSQWQGSGGGMQFFELRAELATEDGLATPSEATLTNNRRLLVADRGKDRYRLLYVTGRPNWEYKFMNRALSEDPQLEMVGLLRVASKEPQFEFKGRAGENSNSLYRGFGREDENERYDEAVLIRMNTRDKDELFGGFPNTAQELFEYDALLLDDIEADFFTFNQLALIRDFVRQRGGGLMMLGGVNSYEDGGYHDSPLAQLLPYYPTPSASDETTDRQVAWDLTRDGWVEPWMRIHDLETVEQQRISQMPLLRVYNVFGKPKPGSRQLAVLEEADGMERPALLVRNFGSGRVASLAVGDLWRWGMQDAASQADLAQFWRQVSRWLVKDNLSRFSLSATVSESGETSLRARALDPEFLPLRSSRALATVTRIASASDRSQTSETLLQVDMATVSDSPGQFTLDLPALEDGIYHASVEVLDGSGAILGEAETGWALDALSAEFASLSPNRNYLERIARATGGEVLELSELPELGAQIRSQPAPATETLLKPIWHNNLFYLAALAAFLGEWLMRRKRGLA